MSKSEWKKWLGVVGRILLAYALILAPAAWAAQSQGAKDKATSQQQVAAQQKMSAALPTKPVAEAEESESAVGQEKNSGDGKHEGIKVHGHWTIEVRNPDGTLATRREFENSLVKVSASVSAGGDLYLVQLLGRQFAQGFWEVQLSAGTPAAGQAPSGPCGGICAVGEGIDLGANSTNLQIAPSAVIPPTLTLSGTVLASSAANIALVKTLASTCGPSATTAACGTSNALNGGPMQFTAAPVNPPVAVLVGQTISVIVVLSFS